MSSIHILYIQAIVGGIRPLLSPARHIVNLQLVGGSSKLSARSFQNLRESAECSIERFEFHSQCRPEVLICDDTIPTSSMKPRWISKNLDAIPTCTSTGMSSGSLALRLRFVTEETEATHRYQGFLVIGEKLQQLELLLRCKRRRVVDRPLRRRRPATSE